MHVMYPKITHKLFTFTVGYQSPILNGTFGRLISESGLEKSEDGKNRTLYSLSYAYATLELIENRIDIYTLAK